MRRFCIILLYAMLSLAGCSEDGIGSGRVGKLSWTVSHEGVLTISGKGAMLDYSVEPKEFLPPWFAHRDKIYKVIIGNNVSNIGDLAFFRCEQINSVEVGSSVTSIGDRAFNGCFGLKSINIPESIKSIYDGAFGGCGLESFTIPDMVTHFGNTVFYGCKELTSVTIGNSVPSIGEYAFFECENLKSVTIGSSVAAIGIYAFYKCVNITEIINHHEEPQEINHLVFGGGLDKIDCILMVPEGSIEKYRNDAEWGTFYKLGMIGDARSVVIGGLEGQLNWRLFGDVLIISGNGVIPDYNDSPRTNYLPRWIVFQEFITHVVIEYGVTRIGNHAFKCNENNCYGNLYSVTISRTVASIGGSAFYCCRGLKEIINHSITPQFVDSDNFFEVSKTECILFVPAASVNAYRSASGWREFANIRAIGD